MSTEALIELLAAAVEDASLRAALECAESPARVVEIGAERGLSFTTEEVTRIRNEVETHGGEALSEDDLEGVAGGYQDGDDIVLRKRPGRTNLSIFAQESDILSVAGNLFSKW